MSSVATMIKLLNKAEVQQKTCDPNLSSAPWNFDGNTGYGPGASADDAIDASPSQGVIPEEYRNATPEELSERIDTARRSLGSQLVTLGHFYQRDEVVRHADFIGDSFQLARAAIGRSEAQHIVFCGVHFMAETADILSRADQNVILPNLAAGCSMADMADPPSIASCWRQLQEMTGESQPAVPVTYMNSSAALKAFCGANGGIVCTSSNADKVLRWAHAQHKRVLFFPDQHLGRNTGRSQGIALEQMPLWNPHLPIGGNTPQSIADARVILWRGWCSVHKRFSVDQIERARSQYPNVRVIVHPECPMEVVDAADAAGSTDFIRRAVAEAEPGTIFAIGTEINMVNRLAKEHPEHKIFCLDPVICPCSTMYRIHPAYLAWVTEELVAGRVVNQIKVPEDVARDARIALERMLEVAV